MGADPAAELSRLADGYMVTQLLTVAAELGLADLLESGPRSTTELAEATGTHGGVLRRILRGLAAEGVLDELPDDRFATTAVGALLGTETAGSLRGYVLARGSLYYAAVAGFRDAVRSGDIPFEAVHGQSLFAYLDAHADQAATFHGSMAARSVRNAAAVLACHDFSRYGSVVDLGGGRHATLLRAVLAATPGLRGLLFDRPEVVAGAPVPAVGGDFFVEIPGGYDCYLLSRVLHDWDDEEAVAILRRCRDAMSETATLLIVEALLPERARDNPWAVRMDLHMLALVPGRERTAAEYAELLVAAGLVGTGAVLADPSTALHVLSARPAG